jgi:hypothetical protein
MADPYAGSGSDFGNKGNEMDLQAHIPHGFGILLSPDFEPISSFSCRKYYTATVRFLKANLLYSL